MKQKNINGFDLFDSVINLIELSILVEQARSRKGRNKAIIK